MFVHYFYCMEGERALDKQEYIVFIGAPCIDEYYTILDNWPKLGDKGNVKFLGNVPGGMIANAACVFAGYGVKTYCFDVMSDSGTTKFLIDDMEENNVDMSKISLVDGLNDAKCIIFQYEGERSIVVVVGDEYKYYVDKENLEFLQNASYIFSTIPVIKRMEDHENIIKALKKSGVKIVLDNEGTCFTEGWEVIMNCAHTAFFNEFSLSVFADGTDEEEFINKLIDNGITNVVVTLGPNGCRVIAENDDFSIPSYDVKKVDTTGAGDTFNSSFMYGMHRGWDIRKCAMFANAAANMSITIQGPRGGITTEKEVENFINSRLSEIPKIY